MENNQKTALIPEKVYKELKASRVKGRYLHFFVRDQYPFEKITA
jgi:hypothetical protein